MLTLGTAKQRLSNLASADELVERINLACELLLTAQNHKGTVERVAFETTGGLLTLPRQYFGCLGAVVDSWVRPIYNHWYEFVGGGPMDSDTAYRSVLDLGDNFVTIKDITSINEDGCVIKVVSELSEDDGLEILLRGLDDDLDVVWTTVEGERLEGEYVALATAGTNSTTTFTTLKIAIKPITKGRVYLYAVDGGEDTLIATYEPAEERPQYRRYRVPTCDAEDTQTVVALCQRRFVDVRDDNDPLPVENINALRDAMQSLQFRAQNDIERSNEYLAAALAVLSKEKRREQPTHTYPPMMHAPGYKPIVSFY